MIKKEGNDFWVSAQKFEITKENIEIGTSESIENIFKVDELKSHELIDTQNGYLILSQLETETYKYIYISNSPSKWKPAADSQ